MERHWARLQYEKEYEHLSLERIKEKASESVKEWRCENCGVKTDEPKDIHDEYDCFEHVVHFRSYRRQPCVVCGEMAYSVANVEV